ncbi:MAG: hypothetical protein KVP17_001890 [Porospora cf. gigantea B]|uniref:uncharacterized protein n=1 Tax=Porospora cf. gigantea B TaxID=2853592 RepID=UPI003571B421|nr:MAG: hypothetical protein KVP17_001890 [Porospora cf. gigantea B]
MPLAKEDHLLFRLQQCSDSVRKMHEDMDYALQENHCKVIDRARMLVGDAVKSEATVKTYSSSLLELHRTLALRLDSTTAKNELLESCNEFVTKAKQVASEELTVSLRVAARDRERLKTEIEKEEHKYRAQIEQTDVQIQEKQQELRRYFTIPLGLRVERGGDGLKFIFSSPQDSVFTITRAGHFLTSPSVSVAHMEHPFRTHALSLRDLLSAVRQAFIKRSQKT